MFVPLGGEGRPIQPPSIGLLAGYPRRRLLPAKLSRTGGATPRDFDFDPSGSILVVANQDEDRVSMFRYSPDDGALTPFGESIEVGTPTAVSFV